MADNLLSRVEILIDANTARFESGMTKAEKVASQSSKNMSGGFERVTVSTKQTQAQIDDFSRTLVRHEVEVSSVSKSYAALKGAALSAIAGLSVSSVIQVADGYGQMAAQIQNATKDQNEYNLVQKHLLETANTTYRSLQEAQQVYLDVGGALQAYGVSTERALRITDSLSFSFTHNATSADKAASATDAFMKSIYTGKVSGDAWVSILSAIPSIVNDLSESLDKSKDEILTMGNAGKFTSTQLNDAFDKSREKSEELANAMRNSLADGITKLSNSFTVLVGEANITYDVTNKAAGGLGILADNLDSVVQVGTVAAAFWAGTYIPSIYSSIAAGYVKSKQIVEQTAVQYAAIQTERVAAAQEIINVEAKLASAQAARVQVIEELKLELQRMKSQISVQGTINSELRMGLLRQQQAVINTELKVTEDALAAARLRSNAAGAAGMGVSSGLLGILTGPVGLGIAVASVAAGYLMMRDTTKVATDAFDIQKGEVEALTAQYRELDELQRRTTMREVEKKVKDLSSAYTTAYSDLSAYVGWLENSGSVSEKTARQMSELLGQYSRGEIDASAFSTSVNNLAGVQEKHKVKIDDLTTAQSKAKVEYERVKSIQAALTSQTESAIDANNREAKSIDAKRIAQQKLNADQQSVYDKLQNQLKREEYIVANMKSQGISRERAEFDADLRNDAKMGYTGEKMPESLRQMSAAAWKLQQDTKARVKAEQESLQAQQSQTKELEKQAQATKRLIGISGNSGIGTGAHLDVRYGGSRDGQKVSKAHLARLEAGGKPLSSYRISSDYGPRKAPVKGASTFHKGTDFAMPIGTPITTNVAVKDVQTSYDPNGGGYYSTVTYADGVVLKLLHQSPGMKGKVKGGSTTGTGSASDELKAFDDASRLAKEQARSRLSLESNIADEVTRIRTNLAEDIKEIDKAGYSVADASELKAKYKERADNEIAIAQQALKTKADSYSKYLKSEEQLLKDSYAERQFDVRHDIELTKTEREQAVEHLRMQLQQELDELKLSRDEQLLDAQSSFMKESEYLQARYDLEIRKIQQIKDEKLKAGLLQSAGQKNSREFYDKRDKAWDNYQNVNADLQGTQQYLELDNNYLNQQSAIQEARDWELITEEEQKSKLLDIERRYQQAKLQLNLNYGEQIAGSATDVMGTVFGKQSAAYKVMFAAQKGFAIAQSMIAIQQGIAQAASLPFPTNLPAMATVAAQTASIVSNIQSVGLTLTGQAHDGIDHVPKEGTWLLDKGERVVDRRTNADLKDFLSANGSSNGNIIINNNAPVDVKAQRNGDGSTTLTIEEVEDFLLGVINDPNSRYSKTMQQSFEIGRKR